mgnify:CR=1 FL=1
MLIVKPVSILSMVTMHTMAMGLLGFFAGMLYSVGGLTIDTLVTIGWITSNETLGLSYGTVLAFGALIGMPMIGAVVGCVIGVAVACLNNMLAALFNRSRTN